VLILHYDLTSPRAALAVLRLQRIADLGHPVAFRGIDVLGVDLALPVTLDQLAELDQVRTELAALGLVARRPTLRPPTLSAHLVGLHAEAAGLGAAWRGACLTAYWTEGADLADHAVLCRLALDAGLDGASVAAVLADHAARNELRARMLQLRQLGIGGVPVLELDGTLFGAELDDATLIGLADA
jgi:2-hydroxychromene-2-carboxylate isomerase